MILVSKVITLLLFYNMAVNFLIKYFKNKKKYFEICKKKKQNLISIVIQIVMILIYMYI